MFKRKRFEKLTIQLSTSPFSSPSHIYQLASIFETNLPQKISSTISNPKLKTKHLSIINSS